MRPIGLALALFVALSCTHGQGGAAPPPVPAAGASETGAAAAPRGETPRVAGLLARVVAKTLDPEQGGSTTALDTGEAVEIGAPYVAVSLAGGEAHAASTPPRELEQELAEFVAARPQLREPRHYLGTWLDKEEALVYFDVTILVPYQGDADRRRALAEANAIGVRNEQRSVFDLGEGKTYRVDAKAQGGALEEIR